MNEGTVRFAVEKGYFVCENEIFKLPLPAIEKLTYLALTRYAGTNNRAWPSYDKLAEDVSCSKRRVIDAVARLVNCNLVGKRARGNRTNIYLIFPPEYYCGENDTGFRGEEDAPPAEPEEPLPVPGGENSSPPQSGRVQNVHPESEQSSPRGCREFTPRVQEVHPKSTKINNKEDLSLNKAGPTGKCVLLENGIEGKGGARELLAEEVEAVKQAFKTRGAQIKDSAVRKLLKDYDLESIRAAIKCTDFQAARNPLAVINWMLATSSYVMPAGKDLPGPEPDPPLPDPAEEMAIRNMIRQAREGLHKKAMLPA